MDLNLSALDNERKAFAWGWIKENKPEVAALIESAFVKSAQKTFAGEIIINVSDSDLADMKEKFAKGPRVVI
ncbi:hypothetical protein [Methylophaga sp.]|jgi:hypothetical protein|uniref:hypothetical protein n=1 Tax=Methylophaga sp. TaxID=2024840 RepID=UPI003A94BBD9